MPLLGPFSGSLIRFCFCTPKVILNPHYKSMGISDRSIGPIRCPKDGENNARWITEARMPLDVLRPQKLV